MLPLLMAVIMAGLTSPVYRYFVKFFHNHKGAASAATVFLTLCLIIIPILFFAWVLVDQAIEITDTAGQWLQENTLQQEIKDLPVMRKLLPYQDKIVEKVSQLAAKGGAFVASSLAAGVKGTAEFFLMLFITLYAMFYFLMNGGTILDEVLRLTPLSASDKDNLLKTFSSVSRATLKGAFIIGILQGGLAGLSFWVAGIGDVVFWGTVMAVLSIIPGIGTFLVWVPVVIFLGLSDRIGAAVGVGLWCLIVVGTVDNLLRPALIGKDTKMPDLLVLISTLGGLILFGAVGIVVGPIFGALFLTVWSLWSSSVDQIDPASASSTAPNG